MRVIFIIICFLGGAAGAYFAQPLMHENTDAVMVIVTVTAVFAGFLVAIVAVLGDPSMIPDGSWKIAEMRRDNVEKRLITHGWLFILYLITIGLLFVGVLVAKADSVPDIWEMWVQRAYLFFGIASFLFTFGLPRALLKLQLARLDAEIERRRRRDGLKD